MRFNMRKSIGLFLMGFVFLLPCNTAFSDNRKTDGKSKAHLLEEIFVLNKQINKMNHINKLHEQNL